MTIAALIISILALLVAGATALYGKQGADAADAAANSSDRSADAAKDSAEQARRVADAEVGRDHLMYEPQQNGQYVLEDGNLYYEFQLPRRYAILARTEAQAGVVFNDSHPSQRTIDGAWRVFVDTWSRTQSATKWDRLTIKFWPPAREIGKPDPWTCPCGRDVELGDKPGHWQWDLGVPQNLDQVVERRAS